VHIWYQRAAFNVNRVACIFTLQLSAQDEDRLDKVGAGGWKVGQGEVIAIGRDQIDWETSLLF
jgi:hypothetical protein